MTKDELHAELDLVVPSGTKARSYVRMIGHCLIELGLVTRIECAYENCVLPSRAFVVALEGEYRGRGIATIDHVTSLSDEGNDRPENLQLMHFACNSAKGARDAFRNPLIRADVSAKLVERWKDPEYRERAGAAQSSAQQRPDVVARKSESMKKTWSDPEHRAARSAAISAGLRRNWAAGRPPRSEA